MISKLLSHVRTVEERDKLLGEIDLLLSSIYQDQGKGFEKTLSARVRFWVSEIIKEEVTNDNNQIEKYLKDLKSVLNAMQTISLKLAFEPTDISIDKFHSYIRNNMKDKLVLLSFDYDPNILGGAAITWQGEYRDLTLKRVFEDEYEAKKGEVMKIMYSK